VRARVWVRARQDGWLGARKKAADRGTGLGRPLFPVQLKLNRAGSACDQLMADECGNQIYDADEDPAWPCVAEAACIRGSMYYRWPA
jgi:hypothetical protein